jgi:hypothetical protein
MSGNTRTLYAENRLKPSASLPPPCDQTDRKNPASGAILKNLAARIEDLMEILEELAAGPEEFAKTLEELVAGLKELAGILEDLAEPLEDLVRILEDLVAPLEDLAAGLEDLAAPNPPRFPPNPRFLTQNMAKTPFYPCLWSKRANLVGRRCSVAGFGRRGSFALPGCRLPVENSPAFQGWVTHPPK